MKNKFLSKGLTLIAGSLFALTLATSANAASLSIVGGSEFELNDKFSLVTETGLAIGTKVLTFDSGNDGPATGLFLAGAPSGIKFEYLGTEAEQRNRSVEYEGTSTGLFQNYGGGESVVGDTKTIGFVNDGALAFFFRTFDGDNNIRARNAGNIAATLTIGLYQESSTSIIALFGDGTGDIDLDDLAMRITVVPLPAALPLYGAGLAVLGFVGWRRKRKAATAPV